MYFILRKDIEEREGRCEGRKILREGKIRIVMRRMIRDSTNNMINREEKERR